LSKKQWIEPEPGWLPLRQAPFSMLKREGGVTTPAKKSAPEKISGSELLARIKSWAMVEERGSSQNDETSLDQLEQILAEKSGADRVQINQADSTFSFWFGPRQTGGGTCLISGSPWIILEYERREITVDPRLEGEALFDPKCITVDDETAARDGKRYRAVCKATGLVWRQYMLRELDHAISRGAISLYARPHAVSAPFEALPADVWPLLRVLDWQNGVAAAADGTVYWSIHAHRSAVDKCLNPVEVSLPQAVIPAPNPSGRPSKQRTRVEQAMRDDIRQGRLTPVVLRGLLEKELKARYSASRDTCRKARNNVLSEFLPKPIADK
jgi:hypothetical protein